MSATVKKREVTLKVRWSDIRHEYKMEKMEFATEVLGVNCNQYYRYEKGTKFPTLLNALVLAKKVNKPLEEIYQVVGEGKLSDCFE
ncbi:MAG: transcriptional regulator [Peptococcaceae bacterium]|nr:transcriptional regulator [Peptococcaceae bacterium]